jgi:uncharacterized membrane-anchored protein
MTDTTRDRRNSMEPVLSKVPEATVWFWTVKVLTTGMGESASDFLSRVMGNAPSAILGVAALATTLTLQFRADRYVAWRYWSAIAMVSVVGTMVADSITISYVVTTSGFLLVLVAVFVAWYRSEGTLSVHSIHTRRRETFYWAAVLATFALGTALGDLTAHTLRLGYWQSGLLFAGLIVVPLLARRALGLNAIIAFWASYVLTRPLGASFADYGAVRHRDGGLDLGTGTIAGSLTVVIVLLVGYLSLTRRDVTADRPTSVIPDQPRGARPGGPAEDPAVTLTQT